VDDPAELHQDLEKKDLKIKAKNRQEKNLSQKTTHQTKKKTHQKNSKNQPICHGVGRDINVQCVFIKEMIIIVDHYTLAVRNRR
jgi:hypothetical protein